MVTAVKEAATAQTEAPITTRFMNALEPSQRVILAAVQERDPESGEPLWRQYKTGRRTPVLREVRFEPHRIGTDDNGNAKYAGYYTPKDHAELAALRDLCARGLIRAREETPQLRAAYDVIADERTRQALA